jgi:chorismate synthase
MNHFGQLFRVSIFGESHGQVVGLTLDGVPAGMPIAIGDFAADMERRKGGLQKGTTPRKEEDAPIFLSGVFEGRTTGAPLTIVFENKNTRSTDYAKQRDVPRPGHADWTAHFKFGGFEDFRGGGHFSGRLTACLVAAGVVAKRLLKGVHIAAETVEIGGEPNTEAGLQKAIDAKDSVGGIVSCTVSGLPAGLGEPFWDSVESLLSHAVFAIPAVRGVEFGTGFAAASMFGSEHNDALTALDGKTLTNHAGGVVGGITNGNQLVLRIAIKPTSSTPKEQHTLNWETGELVPFSVKGRHDLCIALRVPPVLEAVVAIVLADLMMRAGKIDRIWREPIYHVVRKDLWRLVSGQEFFHPDSLAAEGFVHCSEAHQLPGVLERFFAGENNLLALEIDSAAVQSQLKYESSEIHGEKFPHLFGPIPLSALVAVHELPLPA